MRRFVRLFYIIMALAAACSCSPRDRYVTITGFAQGGTYTVKFNMNTPSGMLTTKPEAVRDSIDAILSSIDNSVSGYNKK